MVMRGVDSELVESDSRVDAGGVYVGVGVVVPAPLVVLVVVDVDVPRDELHVAVLQIGAQFLFNTTSACGPSGEFEHHIIS